MQCRHSSGRTVWTRELSGFTLVELLVVVGIISVLISILLPVLSAARDSARTIQCQAKLRQIHAFFTMYAGENKGLYPPANNPAYGGGPSQRVWYRLQPYLPRRLNEDLRGVGYFVCETSVNSTWRGVQVKDVFWTYSLAQAYIYRPTPGDARQFLLDLTKSQRVTFLRRPSDTIMLAEGAQGGVVGNNAAAVYLLDTVLWTPNVPRPGPVEMDRIPLDVAPTRPDYYKWVDLPHKKRTLMNLLYFDGHVDSQALAGLRVGAWCGYWP